MDTPGPKRATNRPDIEDEILASISAPPDFAIGELCRAPGRGLRICHPSERPGKLE